MHFFPPFVSVSFFLKFSLMTTSYWLSNKSIFLCTFYSFTQLSYCNSIHNPSFLSIHLIFVPFLLNFLSFCTYILNSLDCCSFFWLYHYIFFPFAFIDMIRLINYYLYNKSNRCFYKYLLFKIMSPHTNQIEISYRLLVDALNANPSENFDLSPQKVKNIAVRLWIETDTVQVNRKSQNEIHYQSTKIFNNWTVFYLSIVHKSNFNHRYDNNATKQCLFSFIEPQ